MVGVFCWFLLAVSWNILSMPISIQCASGIVTSKAPKIKGCPEVCKCLGNYVVCSSKNFEYVPSNLPHWTTHLNLQNNAIKKLNSTNLKDLTKLTELKLTNNNLTDIPKDAFNYQKELKILELNHNHLKSIEALTFISLEQLTTLKLKRNDISSLQDGAFYGLAHIKKLVLDYNKIEVISKGSVYGLENLRELSLSHNKINVIDKGTWEPCRKLLTLNLSHNELKSISVDTFKDLGSLKKLFLNDNNISFIQENAFQHLQNLHILNLSNNKISYTVEDASGVFQGMRLQRFYLAGNNIKSINKNAFIGLSTVTYLNLDNNNITSIQKNAFAEMTALNELIINTTALICDCNLQWFAEWLKPKSFNVQTVCAYPLWVRGQLHVEVPAENFTCDELPKPRLIEEPNVEIMALKGKNFSLNCKAMSTAGSEMNFQWKKDDAELPTGNIKLSQSTDGRNTEFNSELNIENVQHSDAGKYQCVASNSFGSTYSQKATISVLIFPTFIKIPSNITVQSGDTAKLECAAEGEPQPEIRWQKDGGNDFPAARERRMHVMPTDDVFFIVNAKPTDTGVYSCIARNAAGVVLANATLTVQEKPSFAKPMENKEVVSGSPVVLECMAAGTPKPMVTWLKDNQKVKATERHFFTAEDQLMIIVDTVQLDSGTYQCLLNNSLGQEVGYSNLTVTSDDTIMGIIIITVACCAVLTSCIWVIIIYQTRKRMVTPPHTEVAHLENQSQLEFTDPTQFPDSISDHSSCKDSGTGDSAKRSTEDIAQEDFQLTVHDTNNTIEIQKPVTMRAASLVYIPEGSSSNTPLLHHLPAERKHHDDDGPYTS